MDETGCENNTVGRCVCTKREGREREDVGEIVKRAIGRSRDEQGLGN